MDRWGLQNDLYAQVKSGRSKVEEYLAFLKHYAGEDAYLPLVGISQNLYQLFLIMKEDKRENISAIGKAFLEPLLSTIGYDPDPAETHAISILRDQLLLSAVLYGVDEAIQFSKAKLSALMNGQFAHPDIMKSLMQIGALTGGRQVFDWLTNRLHISESEHERLNILTALGSFKEKELIEKAQRFMLDKVPSRNKFIPICALGANPFATSLMWQWYSANLTELEQLHPIHYERVIAAIVPYSGLGREQEVAAFFDDYLSRNKSIKEVVNLSLEKLTIHAKMRSQK